MLACNQHLGDYVDLMEIVLPPTIDGQLFRSRHSGEHQNKNCITSKITNVPSFLARIVAMPLPPMLESPSARIVLAGGIRLVSSSPAILSGLPCVCFKSPSSLKTKNVLEFVFSSFTFELSTACTNTVTRYSGKDQLDFVNSHRG